jgi:hypothetical protein
MKKSSEIFSLSHFFFEKICSRFKLFSGDRVPVVGLIPVH